MKHLKDLKFQFLLICLTLCFSLLIIGAAFAITYVAPTTYYVSRSGSDSNPGTKEKPFLTIQKGADVVVAGDTVIVKDGIYNDVHDCAGYPCVVRINTNGTSNQWITFKAEHKWGAVIDGNNNTGRYGIIISADYIRIEDFDITKHYWDGILSNEGNNYANVKGNKIHNNGNVTDISCRTNPNCSGHSGVSQGGTSAYYTYDGNLIYSNGRTPDPSWTRSNTHDHGLYIRGSNTTVINNVFYDHQVGHAIQIGPVSTNSSIINNTFGKSIMYNPNDDGQITLWGNVDGLIIQNNIFSEPRGDAFWCASTSGTITVRNNLTSVGIGYLDELCSAYSGAFKLSYNITGQNPLFTDATKHIYKLQSSSPAIDSGLSTNAPAYDFEGGLRPGNKAYDIGAHEYSNGLVQDSPPNPPVMY